MTTVDHLNSNPGLINIQPLFSEQHTQLRKLAQQHDGNPIQLAKDYYAQFSQPELGTNLFQPNPLFDWEDEKQLELLGNLLRSAGDTSHVGGDKTPYGMHPQIVALDSVRPAQAESISTVGSGVLVSSQILLTAFHVWEDYNPDQAFFREEPDPDRDHVRIRKGARADGTDLVALVLEEEVPDTIPPIPLAKAEEVKIDNEFRSVGFGSIFPLGESPVSFYRNHIDLVVKEITATEIIAGTASRYASVNDSGGGLLMKKAEGWVLVGIVTEAVSEIGTSAVRYSRVSAYQDELNEKLEAKGFPRF